MFAKEGNYPESRFGERYDAVLLLSTLSRERPGIITNTSHKSFDVMVPGGIILVQEQFLNAENSGPLMGALCGINRFASYVPAGRVYSARAAADWAAPIGFSDLSFRRVPERGFIALVAGTKS